MPSADTRVMTAHVPLPLAEQVDQLAAKLERSRGWVVKQALAAYVDREAARYQMTLEGLADVDAKKGVSHQDVKAWAQALSAGKSGSLAE